MFSQPGYTEWYTFGDTLVGDQINLTWNAEGIFQFQAVRWELGCSSYPQNITVTIQLCPQELIYIPNSFTPNADGFNDYWKINGMNLFTNATITIFDRYGKLITMLNTKNPYWDGKLNGEIVPSSDYWFVANLGNNTPETKGHFTLKR